MKSGLEQDGEELGPVDQPLARDAIPPPILAVNSDLRQGNHGQLGVLGVWRNKLAIVITLDPESSPRQPSPVLLLEPFGREPMASAGSRSSSPSCWISVAGRSPRAPDAEASSARARQTRTFDTIVHSADATAPSSLGQALPGARVATDIFDGLGHDGVAIASS